ncbi:hypothetical protein Pan216_34990 [Planctomycetes bacterium Pan216]|uniref:Lipoprotein n=1 Tax=Kolteria novifilia TaxID=2527975 RepID=A0A518B6R1_9BACT|nr:hypothetical protein Pan216_34990 [Planctomycetes bacterium Pan216]
MRTILGSLVLMAGMLGAVGCHTCDVCDDCGGDCYQHQAYDVQYRGQYEGGCSSCGHANDQPAHGLTTVSAAETSTKTK